MTALKVTVNVSTSEIFLYIQYSSRIFVIEMTIMTKIQQDLQLQSKCQKIMAVMSMIFL